MRCAGSARIPDRRTPTPRTTSGCAKCSSPACASASATTPRRGSRRTSTSSNMRSRRRPRSWAPWPTGSSRPSSGSSPPATRAASTIASIASSGLRANRRAFATCAPGRPCSGATSLRAASPRRFHSSSKRTPGFTRPLFRRRARGSPRARARARATMLARSWRTRRRATASDSSRSRSWSRRPRRRSRWHRRPPPRARPPRCE